MDKGILMETTNFKFYENFLNAIDLLPEGEREKACYEFCRFGITGELPKDKKLAMFCLGVSVSVQKYQGRGGYREGSGRKNQRNQNNQKNQKNQNNHNEQTETETETETITETEKKEIKEKVVWEGANFNSYSTKPHPDLMFDAEVNKIYKIYEANCPNLIPVGFGFRDLRKRQRIKEFLNVISGDFDYFQKVCSKANTLKVIAGNKIDIDSVINNHVGIYNDKYQAGEPPIDFQAMAKNIADRMEKESKT